MNKLLKLLNMPLKMLAKSSTIMKVVLISVLMISIYSVVFRKESIYENFGNPSSCTYYYMEQCGHCKRFAPEWETFVKTYTGPVKLRKVEASEAGDDLEKYNISGFPTILIIDENGEYMDYDGPRTSEALTKFLSSK